MATDRAPFVAIRTDIRKDERVLMIADVGGYNRHEAMGRLLDLWAWCSDRKLADAPDDCDGYAVPDAVVRRFMGPRGVEAMLGDGCDQLAMSARRPDGLLYLRGTTETVARLRGYHRGAVAGGVARGGGKRDSGGQFVGLDTNDQRYRHPDTTLEPAVHQPDSSLPPAVSSEYPRAQSPEPDPQADPESLIPVKATRARRLEPGWVPERGSANESAEQIAKARGIDLREELAKLHDWAKGNGARRADWNAVWRNWTRNAKTESRRTAQQPTLLQTLMTDINELQRQEDLEKAGAS